MLLKDIDGDGKPEVLFGGDGAMGVRQARSEHPPPPGSYTESRKGFASGHGMGVGISTVTSRMDVVSPVDGGNSQLRARTRRGHIMPHPFVGGAGCICDVNGDGLNDVVTALLTLRMGTRMVRAEATRKAPFPS